MSYIKYIQDEGHYREVLWIGTADIKDLYVGSANLTGAGKHCKQCLRKEMCGAPIKS